MADINALLSSEVMAGFLIFSLNMRDGLGSATGGAGVCADTAGGALGATGSGETVGGEGTILAWMGFCSDVISASVHPRRVFSGSRNHPNGRAAMINNNTSQSFPWEAGGTVVSVAEVSGLFCGGF